jgi:hypothetical protein
MSSCKKDTLLKKLYGELEATTDICIREISVQEIDTLLKYNNDSKYHIAVLRRWWNTTPQKEYNPILISQCRDMLQKIMAHASHDLLNKVKLRPSSIQNFSETNLTDGDPEDAMSLEPTSIRNSARNICSEMPGSENFIPQVLKKSISYQKFEDKDIYPTSTKFLTEVLKVIRVVYRYEEEYSGTQLEYNNLFELIMSLVDNSILKDENAFGFDPEFYKRAWEIIKLELGTNLRLIEELLSFLEKVLVKDLRVYYDNDGNRKEMDGAFYLKGVGQIIDVLRGLFGEGSKNQNVQLIPTIARMVADHPFWGELQKFR